MSKNKGSNELSSLTQNSDSDMGKYSAGKIWNLKAKTLKQSQLENEDYIEIDVNLFLFDTNSIFGQVRPISLLTALLHSLIDKK